MEEKISRINDTDLVVDRISSMEGKKSRINDTDLVDRTNDTDLVDRISSLPDSILGQILSFLPTEEAVATSILSKRWKFAWITVPDLDFCYDGPEAAWINAENMKFIRFVYRVLLLHDSGSLNSFSLVWHSCFSTHAIRWINTAIRRNVRKLYLYLVGDKRDIPISAFSCESLEYLKVKNLTFFHDEAVVCLPRLDTLSLDDVYFKSEEACEKLISGCPILRHITFYCTYGKNADDGDDDFTFIISSPSLRDIEIFLKDRSRVKLKTSSLEYLMLVGTISNMSVEKSLTSLDEVYFVIDLDPHVFPNNSMVEAVRAFDCAKSLRLSGGVMWALSQCTISLSTEFKRLVKLQAGLFCSTIQDIIQNSENLEDLLIYQDSWRPTIDPSNWTDPVQVPRCLSNSLKKVHYSSYNGFEDEHVMIRYMLEHGGALEEMVISCYRNGDGEKLKLLQEICEFPRKSPVCKVQFCA